jgi:hypothetical protein
LKSSPSPDAWISAFQAMLASAISRPNESMPLRTSAML